MSLPRADPGLHHPKGLSEGPRDLYPPLLSISWPEAGTSLLRLVWMCQGWWPSPPPSSPGEESFKPISSLALWIFSRHMACPFLKMQSECMAVACRRHRGYTVRRNREVHRQALLPKPPGQWEKGSDRSRKTTVTERFQSQRGPCLHFVTDAMRTLPLHQLSVGPGQIPPASWVSVSMSHDNISKHTQSTVLTECITLSYARIYISRVPQSRRYFYHFPFYRCET